MSLCDAVTPPTSSSAPPARGGRQRVAQPVDRRLGRRRLAVRARLGGDSRTARAVARRDRLGDARRRRGRSPSAAATRSAAGRSARLVGADDDLDRRRGARARSSAAAASKPWRGLVVARELVERAGARAHPEHGRGERQQDRGGAGDREHRPPHHAVGPALPEAGRARGSRGAAPAQEPGEAEQARARVGAAAEERIRTGSSVVAASIATRDDEHRAERHRADRRVVDHPQAGERDDHGQAAEQHGEAGRGHRHRARVARARGRPRSPRGSGRR